MKRAVEYKTKAHRLAIQITKDIQGGKFASGVLLPPDSELATDYNVSRLTLRKSLTILSENGQIHRLSHGGALAKTNNPCSSENISNSIGAIPQTERKLSIAFVSAGGIFYSTTQYLNGIERYSEESGLKFTHFLVSHHEEVLEVLSRVKEYEIDGVIVNPYKDERYFSMLNTLVEMNFPIVLQNRFDSLPVSSVMSSDGVGAYRMTHYLIEKYQRPVYYICSSSNSEKTPERHEGYKNAMKDAGFEEFIESHTCTKEICNNDPAYWVEEKTWFAGFTAADKLFSQIEFPASIFCENDFDAQGVYEAAKKHHLSIGKDVMLAGFDDYPLAKLIKPGLTTCHAFSEKLGYEGGRLLHRLMKKEVQPPVHIRLPMQLIIRESS